MEGKTRSFILFKQPVFLYLKQGQDFTFIDIFAALINNATSS